MCLFKVQKPVQMTAGSGRRLRQWLIEQIHSGLYPGLQWEDEGHTMFRIPWKHAGKQDYNQEVDASIFKAWAMFKGKFKEGDKAEPATWKTRLRCALNKSPDFEEVSDRSQLDISEPYKVYRIISEEEQKRRGTMVELSGDDSSKATPMECSSEQLQDLFQEPSNEDIGDSKGSHSPPGDCFSIQPSKDRWSQDTPFCPGAQVSSPADIRHVPSLPGHLDAANSSMMIAFFYGGKLVATAMSTHSDGCRIAPLPPSGLSERLLNPNTLQNISFPPVEVIENERQRQITRKLFGHLERGVLLRSNREGIFIKRLCQSRIFWSGLGSQCGTATCKLDRDAVVKIFNTSRFLQALQMFQEGQHPAPDPTVTLCFGEDFHDIGSAKSKLIIVQITSMSCQHLVDTVTTRRFLYAGGSLETAEDHEQIAHIFHDLCSYTLPTPSFCENQPISV
ncbi:interferon regulatory factor 8-like isoform X2 [Scleropages formosus]|uniref:interferon regulatory factor 8-like isoform X2 n=1 Tax=Scleropages formosus TaxID=113540 RepID=UPI000878A5C1|nr:interferon regulatory factor 8-like isoform X2 [Scleropages formosus]